MAVSQVLVLALDEVRVPERRFRSLKPADAAAIGAAIAADRQYQPITVTRVPGRDGYLLVDGWHRLEGCRMAGLPTIEARLIGPDKGARVREEAVSGIARAQHDVFDRAAAIIALGEAIREEMGLPKGDLRRRPDAERRALDEVGSEAETICSRVNNRLGWDEAVAERLGCSGPTVRRLVVVHERIADPLKDRLRAAGHAGRLVPLYALAGQEVHVIEAVVGLLESGCASIAEAIDQATARPQLSAEQKRLQSAKALIDRMGARERQGFFDMMAAMHLQAFRRAIAKAQAFDGEIDDEDGPDA